MMKIKCMDGYSSRSSASKKEISSAEYSKRSKRALRKRDRSNDLEQNRQRQLWLKDRSLSRLSPLRMIERMKPTKEFSSHRRSWKLISRLASARMVEIKGRHHPKRNSTRSQRNSTTSSLSIGLNTSTSKTSQRSQNNGIYINQIK